MTERGAKHGFAKPGEEGNFLLRKRVALGLVVGLTLLAIVNYLRLSIDAASDDMSVVAAWISLAVAVVSILFCYYALFGNWRRRRSGTVAQLAIAVLTLVITPLQFAVIFTVINEHAVCLPTDPPPTGGSTAYFAYVTFTTLGYGDIAPLGICRGIAAATALTGYITLGAFMGILMQQSGDAEK